MQRFKPLFLSPKHSRITTLPILSHLRNFSSSFLTQNSDSEDLQNQVLVEGNPTSRTAILNRSSALNALNTNMCSRLQKLYESWEEDPNIGFVVLKGSGSAFCAGGDIVALYRLLNEGKVKECKEFFRSAYGFMYFVGTYLKPHVALMDGVTMGGGAGISIPGTFRVVTDKTIFATPETQIGFHPDAGASFYLSRLPGFLGEYLALTGDKLNGVEMMACGLATHYSPSTRLTWIEERLRKLVTDDPSTIETSLEEFSIADLPEESSIMHRIETIDKCFSHDTVEEIVDAMETEATGSNDELFTSALKKLKQAAPLSLKVALKSIRDGRYQTFDQCMVREYRMSLQAMSKQISNDFSEGVQARLVEKDFLPKWNPSCLEQVSQDMVNSYFTRLSDTEADLELPIKPREAFV
ncbi:hypothetical protein MKX03_022642 [Papaver bracteatum]|nr:hypothetical protein MKX03_022642 [Papaver bracteatum]